MRRGLAVDHADLAELFQAHVAGSARPVVVLLQSSAPTRRTIAASFGKMATTSVRRLISPLRRSSGLVECNCGQCSVGKAR